MYPVVSFDCASVFYCSKIGKVEVDMFILFFDKNKASIMQHLISGRKGEHKKQKKGRPK